MTPLRLLPRVVHVAAVLVRYRIDDLIDEAHVMRPLRWLRALLPRPRKQIAALPRGARLRMALTELGPIWVKAGQVLSTRRDLIPTSVCTPTCRLGRFRAVIAPARYRYITPISHSTSTIRISTPRPPLGP
jgi:ubiquinone biosynthesis protein